MKEYKKFSFAALAIVCSATLFNCRPSATVGELTGTSGEIHLQDTDWEIIELNGVPADPSQVLINFASAENRISGSLPCNKMGGTYTLDRKKIIITMFTTKMACEGKMGFENSFTEAMRTVSSYSIKERELTLHHDKVVVAKFSAYRRKTI